MYVHTYVYMYASVGPAGLNYDFPTKVSNLASATVGFPTNNAPHVLHSSVI